MRRLLDCVKLCSGEARECDLSLNFTALTNTILCRMAMSTTCDAEEIRGLVPEFVNLAAKLGLVRCWGLLGSWTYLGLGEGCKK